MVLWDTIVPSPSVNGPPQSEPLTLRDSTQETQMTAASELKKTQTEEEKQIQAIAQVYVSGATLEHICYTLKLDYHKTLASDAVAQAFPDALMNQAAYLREEITLKGEKLREAHDATRQISAERLNLEIELEGLMARIAQVRQLQ
jgi:hypothetical protein